MAVSFTYSNRYKYALMKKLLDISADTIKVLLMRNGFVFNKDDHATLINIKKTLGATTLSVVASTGSITKAGGTSFITEGYVAGNQITTSGFANAGNNSTFIIATVAANEITVTDNTGMVNETGSGDEVIISDDELITGNGYTQDTKTTGTITMAAEDDTNDRCDATFPTVQWTASVGNIGPTPGAILYDDTATENTIIGYFNFDGAQTISPPDSLFIGNGTLRTA